MKDSDSDPEREEAQGEAGGIAWSSGAWLVWLMSCILAAGVSASIMKTLFRCIMPVEFVSGWLLAVINAAVGVLININAMKEERKGFVIWGAGGNVLRSLGVLVIILVIKFSGVMKFESFITVFLAGYFVFMIAETVRMNVVNFRSMRQK